MVPLGFPIPSQPAGTFWLGTPMGTYCCIRGLPECSLFCGVPAPTATSGDDMFERRLEGVCVCAHEGLSCPHPAFPQQTRPQDCGLPQRVLFIGDCCFIGSCSVYLGLCFIAFGRRDAGASTHQETSSALVDVCQHMHVLRVA